MIIQLIFYFQQLKKEKEKYRIIESIIVDIIQFFFLNIEGTKIQIHSCRDIFEI